MLIVSPFIIRSVTELVKKIKVVSLSSFQVSIVRTFVAAASFAAVVGTSVLSGTDIDQSSITTFSEAILLFIATTGVHYFRKYNQ